MKTQFNPSNFEWPVDIQQPVFVKTDGNLMHILFDFVEVPATTTTVPDGSPSGSEGGAEALTPAEPMVEAQHVVVPQPASRAHIIDVIISSRYDNSEEKAIMNNHLMDPTEDHEAEFEEYKKWRAHAKAIADIVLETI